MKKPKDGDVFTGLGMKWEVRDDVPPGVVYIINDNANYSDHFADAFRYAVGIDWGYLKLPWYKRLWRWLKKLFR